MSTSSACRRLRLRPRRFVRGRVLDFGRKKHISAEFRPFRPGPVRSFTGRKHLYLSRFYSKKIENLKFGRNLNEKSNFSLIPVSFRSKIQTLLPAFRPGSDRNFRNLRISAILFGTGKFPKPKSRTLSCIASSIE